MIYGYKIPFPLFKRLSDDVSEESVDDVNATGSEKLAAQDTGSFSIVVFSSMKYFLRISIKGSSQRQFDPIYQLL